jgi:hypothetical protein
MKKVIVSAGGSCAKIKLNELFKNKDILHSPIFFEKFTSKMLRFSEITKNKTESFHMAL